MRTDIGILANGSRNDGLTRLGGAMRRKGSSLAEIEAALFEANSRRCRPPLTGAEVTGIARSVASYPVGGPDPLETAWEAVSAQPCESNFDRFIALARQLQVARPGQTVALPLKRTGELMGLDWTTVRGYRQAAVRDDLLELAIKHVPNKRAALFRVHLSSEGQEFPVGIPTNSFSSGLVGIRAHAPSGNAHGSPSGNETTGDAWGQLVRLAGRGFRLFPCRPGSKLPQIKAWQHKATCDVAQLSQWFQRFPGCNWAVACGEGSGLWVLDIDSDPAGAAMMRRFQEHGYIGPETLCVRTGREFAYHLYFLHPKGARIANKAGIKGWHEDLDVRGAGGYVMVPPSIWSDDAEKAKAEGREIRPSQPYTFLQGDDCPIAEAPAWLLAVIGVMSAAETMTGPVAPHQGGARHERDSAIAKTKRAVTSGTRWRTILRSAHGGRVG